MCKFISFHHKPIDGEIAVSVLDSHSDTEKNLKLNLKLWREAHYLPDGKVDLRFTDDDKIDREEYRNAFLNRFPTFISFFNWCLIKTNQREKYGGSLYLSALTSAEGLVLPKEIGGWLDLSALTSAEGLVLPKKIGGSLNLKEKIREELKNKRG